MQKQKGNQHSNPDHKVDVVDGQFVLARVSFDPLLVAEVLPSSPRGRKLSAVLLVPHSDRGSSILVPAVVQYTMVYQYFPWPICRSSTSWLVQHYCVLSQYRYIGTVLMCGGLVFLVLLWYSMVYQYFPF